MGLQYNEDKEQWEWSGDVKGLVAVVGDGDARMGFVIDKASGAKIAMNISGTDEPADEPFYIESPDGENLYDAYNRKEAVNMLTAARQGKRDLDSYMYEPSPKPKVRKPSGKRKSTKKSSSSASMGRLK